MPPDEEFLPESPRPAAPDPDPVLRRRARVARLTDLAQRAGYLLIVVAVVGFVVGYVAQFPGWSVTLVTTSLVLATVLLAPAIVLAYAVKAAEREDRERKSAG